MSADEVLALITCAGVAAAGWAIWYMRALLTTTLGTSRASRLSLYVLPLLCAMTLYAVLRTWSSFDVRDSSTYLAFYELMGMAWLAVALSATPLLGLSPRDDVLERRNQPAGYAVAGAMLGITCCFAGGNIGNGPGWWVVLFSAGLATLTLLVLWGAIEWVSDLSDAITVERDEATGLRLGGFLLGAGLILGRGVAGDWQSAADTVRDFALVAWPVLPMLAVAAVMERLHQPTTQRLHPSVLWCGLLPALSYVIFAACYVYGVGAW